MFSLNDDIMCNTVQGGIGLRVEEQCGGSELPPFPAMKGADRAADP